ncbi:hypothetical protein tinsulaeT_26400 [Thalassotalea insulae]|uniref:N-acetyltransferase domain-containing protein n=1 Tax=Thalassotalea insulae TaxID=2056778 RepID=A0ABQ6GXQ1_9GAMM|nr:GNAT family N-acetyltransferase [Thalassotalea insulae]GLX79300.1 hypothetical protein tinsulaeT_26400 [Thalassotalea insulae]
MNEYLEKAVTQFPQPSLINRIAVTLFHYFPRRLIAFVFQSHCKLYQHTLLLKKNIFPAESLPEVQNLLPSDVEIGLLNEDILEQMIRHSEALPEKYYRQRLAEGDICYYQTYKQELVNYNWISLTTCSTYRGSAKEIPFYWLGKGQAFTYDFYTYQQYRRKGYGAMIKRYMIADLAAKGINTIYSSVEPGNINSLNIHLRLGYQLVNAIQNFKFMDKTFSLWANEHYRQKILKWLISYQHQLNSKKRK